MDPILLAIFSMVFTGISDFLYRRARIAGASPKFFLLLQAIFFNTLNYCYIVLQGSLKISVLTVFFGVCCGFLGYFSILLFLKSLGQGYASINAPIFRLSFIITAILAITFLNEILSFGKILAISLAVFSIIALSKGLKNGHISSGMILPLLLATLLNGLVGFLYKIAISSGSTPTGILVIQGAVFITCSFIIAIRSGTVVKSRSVMIHAPICGILLGSAFLLLLESLKYGEVSVNFSIVQLSFVLTSVLAIIILREKFRIINLVGIIAAILSVMSFAYL